MMTMMLVMDTRSGQFGGTERNTLSLALTLSRRGHRVHVVMVGQALHLDTVEYNDLAVEVVGDATLEHVPASRWQQLLAEIAPQVVVHSKGWFKRRNVHLDALVAKLGLVYLAWEHHPAPAPVGTFARRSRAMIARFLEQPNATLRAWLARRQHLAAVHRTLCVSEAIKAPLVAHYGFAATQLDVIYPGIDVSRFVVDTDKRRQFREVHHIPPTASVVGSIGRLVAHKRNDLVLRAFAALRMRHPDHELHCIIGGTGPDLERLQGLAVDLGIAPWVHFVGWVDDVSAVWNGIDIFALPSEDEGLAVVLIEAIACGCLPLAARVGGMPEVVEIPGAALLVEQHEPTPWADAMERLLLLPLSEREALSERLRRHISTRFDGARQWGQMADWVEQQTARVHAQRI